MKKHFLFTVLLFAYPLFADEIHLIDNTIHKGMIINITGEIIEYSTQEKGKTTFPREQVEKIKYDNGKEIDFYDKIYFIDDTLVKGKVIKAGEEYLEYNPAGSIPYDRTDISKIAKIIYDNGKTQNFLKATDTDLIYFKDGRIIKAKGIIISNKNIEFYDEKNMKQFYGLNMIEKIIYQDGKTEYPDKIQNAGNLNTGKGKTGKPVESFFEFELGWNGYVGLGARLDYLIFNNASLNGGAGLGMWGYRLSGALRYYIEYPYGLAFSIGAAYNTGTEYEDKFDTQDPGTGGIYSEKVKFKLKPVTCINASILYSIQVNGNNRIYIEAGYSYAIQKAKYTYTTESGRELTDESEDFMDLMAPGGFMITVGYAFAI